VEPCKFENRIIEMATNVESTKTQLTALDKRINGSFEKISKHVSDGNKWRMAIIGIVFAIIVQGVAFAYNYGKQSKTLEYLEKIVTERE